MHPPIPVNCSRRCLRLTEVSQHDHDHVAFREYLSFFIATQGCSLVYIDNLITILYINLEELYICHHGKLNSTNYFIYFLIFITIGLVNVAVLIPGIIWGIPRIRNSPT